MTSNVLNSTFSGALKPYPIINWDKSFTTQAFECMLSSDIFNPSNCVERQVQDMGSIRHSLPLNTINIFDRKFKDVTSLTYIAKSARAVLRYAGGFFIQISVAPAGALYHGVCFGGYLTKHIILVINSNEDRAENWTKVKNHAAAFFTEGFIAFLGCLSFGFNRFHAKDMLIDSIKFFKTYHIKDAVFTILLVTCIANLIPFLSATVYKDFLSVCITNQSERAGFYKSVILKNDFGITGPGNKLLSWDFEQDQEYLNRFEKGSFGNLYKKQCLDFLWAIKHLQEKLPLDNPLNYQQIFGEGDFEPSIFISYLKENFSENLSLEKLEAFERLKSNIYKMECMLSECLELKETSLLKSQRTFVTIPFPWDDRSCQIFFRAESLPEKQQIQND